MCRLIGQFPGFRAITPGSTIWPSKTKRETGADCARQSEQLEHKLGQLCQLHPQKFYVPPFHFPVHDWHGKVFDVTFTLSWPATRFQAILHKLAQFLQKLIREADIHFNTTICPLPKNVPKC